MSASAIMQAAQSILAAAVPEASVVLGIPATFVSNNTLYLYHDGSSDVVKAAPNVIRRTHIIPFHLLLYVADGADEQALEVQLLTFHDRITNLFYGNHRLNGTAAMCAVAQRDGAALTPVQYVLDMQQRYRHRSWTLSAMEDLNPTFA